MNSIHLANLPVSGDGCGSIRIVASAVDLVVEYEYQRQGQGCVGSLIFTGLIAFKFSAEIYSAGYIDSSYDSLVCIPESAWINGVLAKRPSGLRAIEVSHFAVFFSNNGFLEILAEGWEGAAERMGRVEPGPTIWGLVERSDNTITK